MVEQGSSEGAIQGLKDGSVGCFHVLGRECGPEQQGPTQGETMGFP